MDRSDCPELAASAAALWSASWVGKGICGLFDVAGWSDLMRLETSTFPVGSALDKSVGDIGEDPNESFATAGTEHPNNRTMVAREVDV